MSYFPASPYTQFLQTTKADPGGANKKLQRWQEIISPPGVAGRFGTAVFFWEGWGNNCLAFKNQQKNIKKHGTFAKTPQKKLQVPEKCKQFLTGRESGTT